MTRAFGGLSLSDTGRCMSSTVAVGQLSVWGRRKFASFDSGTSDGSSLDHLPSRPSISTSSFLPPRLSEVVRMRLQCTTAVCLKSRASLYLGKVIYCLVDF